MVRKLKRRRAGTAFATIDGDIIGADAGFNHRFADRQKLAAFANAQLETDRLATA